jgi:lambda family phage portal protein
MIAEVKEIIRFARKRLAYRSQSITEQLQQGTINARAYFKALTVARQWSAGYFHAADSSRLLGSWLSSPLTPDEVIRRNLRKLRARSRDETDNNPLGRKFTKIIDRNIIGPHGIRLQAKAVDEEGKLDKKTNAAIEAAWQDWGSNKRVCDYVQRLSWRAMQSLWLRTVAVDGEIFTRFVEDPALNRYGFAVHLLDPELIDVDHNEELSYGRFIRMGIEFDPVGRPIAYHVLQGVGQSGMPDYTGGYHGEKRIRIPANQIEHSFVVERIGQKRGMPWTGTSLFTLRMLGAYKEAAVTNARIGASKMGLLKRDQPDAEFTGDRTQDDGTQEIDIEPGMFRVLPRGMSMEKFDTDYPHGEFPSFVEAEEREAAAGLDVSYAALTGDLTKVNYSSIRAGLVEDRANWECMQQLTIEEFALPAYQRWLNMALLMSAISNGKPLNPAEVGRYMHVTHQPKRWPWVDPDKDTKAKQREVRAGVASLSGWIRERGLDPEEVWKEIQQEREMLAEMGIEISLDDKAVRRTKPLRAYWKEAVREEILMVIAEMIDSGEIGGKRDD